MTLDVTIDPRNINIMPATELEEIAQNVQMIIATLKGTVPMYREFGIDPRLIDQPLGVAQARLSAEIATAIRTFEPRAKLQRVLYSGEAMDGQLKITVRLDINEKLLRGGV